MKNLYLKNKGKVYPSPSPSSSTDSALNLLNLLPAAILALASILSAEDREVLAYLITTNPSSVIEDRRKKCKNPTRCSSHVHRVPLFECGCFECYTSYWFRWDSSPNRELIHQVIEAFEDHLTRGERTKTGGGGGGSGGGGRTKKREKSKLFDETLKLKKSSEKKSNSNSDEIMKPQPQPQPQPQIQVVVVAPVVSEEEKVEEAAEEVVVGMGGGCYSHKGLARKVLPDVMGLFNSRIWNLWSNNI